jgi:hypothetical protein
MNKLLFSSGIWLAFALFLILTKDENTAMIHVAIICGTVCSAAYEIVKALTKGTPS